MKPYRSLLETLPYPLLTPSEEKSHGANRLNLIGRAQKAPKQPVYSSQTIAAADTLIQDLSKITHNPGELSLLAQELNLQQIYGTVYCAQNVAITPLLRALGLSRTGIPRYLNRGRISLETAAWIWGYHPGTPDVVHIDLHRNLRVNRATARKLGYEIHEVRPIPFDNIKVGTLNVATPLRTLIDLLFKVSRTEKVESLLDDIIFNILEDGEHNGCAPATVQTLLEESKHRRYKNLAKQRLDCLLQSLYPADSDNELYPINPS